jgi:endonuclease YncB( thermonuclease family)
MRGLIITAAALLLACAPALAIEPVAELVPVEYVRTIDGDTIVVLQDGEELRVRLLGIDAPELDSGEMAAFDAAGSLAGWLELAPAVYLEYDADAGHDAFGRELAWVWYDDAEDGRAVRRLANLQLVEFGLAWLYEDAQTSRYAAQLALYEGEYGLHRADWREVQYEAAQMVEDAQPAAATPAVLPTLDTIRGYRSGENWWELGGQFTGGGGFEASGARRGFGACYMDQSRAVAFDGRSLGSTVIVRTLGGRIALVSILVPAVNASCDYFVDYYTSRYGQPGDVRTVSGRTWRLWLDNAGNSLTVTGFEQDGRKLTEIMYATARGWQVAYDNAVRNVPYTVELERVAGGVGGWTQAADDDTPGRTRADTTAQPASRAGADCVLTWGGNELVFGGTSYDGMWDVVDVAVDYDLYGMAELLDAGHAVIIEPGTAAKLLDAGIGYCVVRILSGEHTGLKAWVLAECVQDL